MTKSVPHSGKNHEMNLLEELQASLVKRFGRAQHQPEPLVFEFTNDRGLLHQYYRLREIMYRKVFNTDKFVGEEDVHDRLSHILIARRGRLCVGGCRLTIREADEDFLLPMENADFKLRNIFPNLPLRKLRQGEISRFAIMDEDEDKLEIMGLLSQLIIEKCNNSELGYVFLKSSLPMARNWRKIGQTLCGLKKMRICTEVKVPANPIHPEITWYLTEIPLAAAENIPTPYEEVLTSHIDSLVH